MTNAIITLAVGDSPLWEISHALMQAYAKRIGCDFIKITGKALEKVEAHSRKLEIAGYLKDYERILFFDGDVVIHKDCPDLFDLVPDDMIGATVEREPYFKDRPHILSEACNLYGVKAEVDQLCEGNWFNSGVMVISRNHADMFRVPEGKKLTRCHGFKDQALLNATRIKYQVPLYDLGFRFNYIASVMFNPDRPMSPFDADVFHATGFLSPAQFRFAFMKQFDAIWKQKGTHHPESGKPCRIKRMMDRFFHLKIAMMFRKNPFKRWVLYAIATVILQLLTTLDRLRNA